MNAVHTPQITDPDFLLAFWAPFAPSRGWDAERTLARHRAQIAEVGFALWTFDRMPGMIPQWQAEIRRMGGGQLPAFGGGADEVRPADGPRTDASHWLPFLDAPAQPLPTGITARYAAQANDHGQLASAFVVEDIQIPAAPMALPGTPVEWWKKDDGFVATGGAPGVFLARPAPRDDIDLLAAPGEIGSEKLLGGRAGGPVHFVLTLREPWVTLVGNASLTLR